MTRSFVVLALLGVLQLLLACYALWQLWWLSAAWEAVVHEGEPIGNMTSSIDARVHRLHGVLLLLLVITLGSIVAAAFGARRRTSGR
jgi:multisubunit Na+/H+ antiporter MnhB subunit